MSLPISKKEGATTTVCVDIMVKTLDISAAMALLHGGEWRVQVDHAFGYVLIVRRVGKQD